VRRIILSLATADGRYPRQLERLAASVKAARFTGETRFWRPGTVPPGCPPHLESPFAFKPYAFAAVEREGSGLALWLDAACVVIRPLDEMFARIEREGYVLCANGGRRVGEWASDAALAHFGISRESALTMTEVNAAVIGLNPGHPVAAEFLARWKEAAADGVAFRGQHARFSSKREYLDVKWNHGGRASGDRRVLGHRHDQTVAGILAHRLRMAMTTEWVESSSGGRATRPGTIVVIDRDGGRPDASRALARFVRRHPTIAALVRRGRRRWLGLRGR
jgi:hypothetical protein